MTSSVLMRLCNIALKPGISASTKLITTRRICRIVADRLDSITAERRTFRREAGKLKPFLPFTKRAIADIERQAMAHREAERTGARAILTGFGKSFMFDRDGLAEALGFDRMCDLLSVNAVHRHQAVDDGDTSLRGVAYLSQLEDSSAGYGDDWGDRWADLPRLPRCNGPVHPGMPRGSTSRPIRSWRIARSKNASPSHAALTR